MERSKLNSNHKDTTRNSSFESIAICLELSPLHHLLIEVLKSKQEDPYELSCHLVHTNQIMLAVHFLPILNI
ncbi:unnamed protein product [Rotaria magnacalcarata]|uniref:Uncharacterized protein n=1 Tax=Rotaria magnacalcarata TaxID=392030 RepID=A0A820B2U0_9BILA|nr:unnamed protein product [Rotaria magnacalcarata]CAF4200961.1 unnamed protein product [Rotaria magnacalcarata]